MVVQEQPSVQTNCFRETRAGLRQMTVQTFLTEKSLHVGADCWNFVVQKMGTHQSY